MASSFLLVIGDREGLAWILRERRMAFPPRRRLGVEELREGDELFLVTTRGCFRNPSEDRTRIIGKAYVASPVVPLEKLLELADRTFDRACDLLLDRLAPFREGIELKPLVASLDSFPNKEHWSFWLRRPLLRLSKKDVRLIARRVQSIRDHADGTVAEYLEWIAAHPSSRHSER